MGADQARFRRIFRRVHRTHTVCVRDEWLGRPCHDARGRVLDRPVVWSRRNGPWRQVPLLFVGAAPGNAGGRGRSDLGAHGTRIPFGGDIAGANLDVLIGSVGCTRNDVFLTASYNALPARGGGEPTPAEIRAPVGAYPTSLHLLRDTIIAAGAPLVIALGNVAMRCTIAALRLRRDGERIPTQRATERLGAVRDAILAAGDAAPDTAFRRAWQGAWQAPLPVVLWTTHPSAQNMSPFARADTLFHTRMLDTRAALQTAARDVLGIEPPAERPPLPDIGIYALPEWRERVAPQHARLDDLWRAHGV